MQQVILDVFVWDLFSVFTPGRVCGLNNDDKDGRSLFALLRAYECLREVSLRKRPWQCSGSEAPPVISPPLHPLTPNQNHSSLPSFRLHIRVIRQYLSPASPSVRPTARLAERTLRLACAADGDGATGAVKLQPVGRQQRLGRDEMVGGVCMG
ncbi:unnamed protein product [Pleuronectes platessa]|uniref:Uncharacterized protein n=1 Tax=Pleuronectes platessa TaxID=8262 RepID=A0A9N7U7Q4_PLEPL|nr:unnamed protein product [Pleuronectes platessa]